jgi:hypothetical protein
VQLAARLPTCFLYGEVPEATKKTADDDDDDYDKDDGDNQSVHAKSPNALWQLNSDFNEIRPAHRLL